MTEDQEREQEQEKDQEVPAEASVPQGASFKAASQSLVDLITSRRPAPREYYDHLVPFIEASLDAARKATEQPATLLNPEVASCLDAHMAALRGTPYDEAVQRVRRELPVAGREGFGAPEARIAEDITQKWSEQIRQLPKHPQGMMLRTVLRSLVSSIQKQPPLPGQYYDHLAPFLKASLDIYREGAEHPKGRQTRDMIRYLDGPAMALKGTPYEKALQDARHRLARAHGVGPRVPAPPARVVAALAMVGLVVSGVVFLLVPLFSGERPSTDALPSLEAERDGLVGDMREYAGLLDKGQEAAAAGRLREGAARVQQARDVFNRVSQSSSAVGLEDMTTFRTSARQAASAVLESLEGLAATAPPQDATQFRSTFTGVTEEMGLAGVEASPGELEAYLLDVRQSADAIAGAYNRLSQSADAFDQAVARLGAGARGGNIQQTSSSLAEAVALYREIAVAASSIRTPAALELANSADRALTGALGQAQEFIERVPGTLSSLQVERTGKALYLETLEGEQSGLKSSFNALEAQASAGHASRWRIITSLLKGMAPWIGIAFAGGVVLLLPWYRKYLPVKASRTSPLTIALVLFPLSLVILVAYLVVRGYIGAVM